MKAQFTGKKLACCTFRVLGRAAALFPQRLQSPSRPEPERSPESLLIPRVVD